jgi:pimeloyl-ACP methyl ester carboxylesterase
MNRLTAILLTSFVMFPFNLLGDEKSSPFNVEGPTFGGKQIWTDELVFHEWRVQRNALSGHHRLLDNKNFRKAWGSFEHCRKQLEAFKRELKLPPMQGKAVIVLHGLVRSRQATIGMCEYLREQGDYLIVNVSYASTRERVEKHAKSLASVIDHLGPEVTEINFVAHSLGNLVVRHYLADQLAAEDRQPDPRIKRLVMLAPPNNGSQFAVKFTDNKIFQTIWGASGLQLAKDWKALEKKLATPTQEFGIIAGGRGKDNGSNPILDGDDDFVVSIEETRLPGANDFVVLPVLHSLIMDDPKTREYTLRFLWHGYFVSKEDRTPIPLERQE